MSEIKRESPVRFKAAPQKTEVRDNWTVALEYDDEGQGPWLVDLATRPAGTCRTAKSVSKRCEMMCRPVPGACTFADDTLVNRMNRTQASIYHLGAAATGACPIFQVYRCHRIHGFRGPVRPQAFSVAEKLTNLDFLDPAQKQALFCCRAPFATCPVRSSHWKNRPTAVADSC
jgi:hypothetical protein